MTPLRQPADDNYTCQRCGTRFTFSSHAQEHAATCNAPLRAVPKPKQSPVEAVLATLRLLADVYNDDRPDIVINGHIDGPSFTSGFHRGARSAYNDAYKRINEAFNA